MYSVYGKHIVSCIYIDIYITKSTTQKVYEDQLFVSCACSFTKSNIDRFHLWVYEMNF